MAEKNDVQVIIDGKVITLSGYESNDYLQKVASYIDNKIKEIVQNDTYRRHNYEMQHTMIELNIADDYFKVKKQTELLQEDVEQKEKEIYDLKHELIAVQLKLESAEKRLTKTKKELSESQKQIIRLETELKTKNDSVAD